MEIDNSLNNYLKQVDFRSRNSINFSGSRGELYARSNVISHICGKRGHLNKEVMSKENGYCGNPYKNPNELPKYVTKKHVVSDPKDLAKVTMTR